MDIAPTCLSQPDRQSLRLALTSVALRMLRATRPALPYAPPPPASLTDKGSWLADANNSSIAHLRWWMGHNRFSGPQGLAGRQEA